MIWLKKCVKQMKDTLPNRGNRWQGITWNDVCYQLALKEM